MTRSSDTLSAQTKLRDGRLAIHQVRSARELDEVVGLCDAFLAWMRRRYAGLAWTVDRYYTPEVWADLMRSLPEIHTAPRGEILLARLDCQPVGCVMMQPIDDKVCEMKRLFVADAARGLGLGRRLSRNLMRLAAEEGYRFMRLETGFRHDEAAALYRTLGFRPIGPYKPYPDEMEPYLVFMQAELHSGDSARFRPVATEHRA